MESMITAATWVPRGHAAQFPRRYEFDDAELERIGNMAQDMVEQAREDLADQEEQEHTPSGASEKQKKKSKASKQTADAMSEDDDEDEDEIANDADLKEYDLDHYDDDEDAIGEDGEGERGGDAMGFFGSVKNLAYYTHNDEDPYITLPQQGQAAEEDDEEREELQILNTDNLLLAARVEDEVAHLEVYVYEDGEDNLYVHHDVMLPAIPLCVEWLNYRVRGQTKDAEEMSEGDADTGNFAAVGTMDPDIEVWDLDVVDGMYPSAILGQGGGPANTRRGKKKKRSKKTQADYHVDAVLDLAANRQHRNLLASASADTTVKLWDLTTCKAAQSYSIHEDKVCSLAWHPKESTALLSGGYDAVVAAGDMRAPDVGLRKWKVDSDVESVRWDPHNDNCFYAACESGMLFYFDARKVEPGQGGTSKPVWRLQAHDGAVSSFAINPNIPGYLATGSSDKQVKLWNVQGQGKGPSMVVSRDVGVGRVFSTNFAPDNEVSFRLACAGSEGQVQIWDTSSNKAVRAAFGGRLKHAEQEVEEKLIGLNLEDDSGTDEDESEGEGVGLGGDDDEESEGDDVGDDDASD